MKKFFYAGAALTALVAGPALAADLPARTPVYKSAPPVVWTWTGCYIGGNVGGDWAKSTWSYRNINPYDALNPAGPAVGTENSFSMSSWTAGAQIGCNYEFINRWVIGIEASWSGTRLSQTNPNVVQVFAGSQQTVETTINSYYMVTGRLGYAWSPAWLGYVKGGFASARIETTGTTSPPVAGLSLDWSTSQWHNGYVLGLGAEYRITQNITFGVEYNYIGLRNVEHIGAVSGGLIGPANQIVHDVNGNIQSVIARVNFLFGGGGAYR